MKKDSKKDSKIVAEEIWNETLSELRLQMTHATFDTWLARTRVVDLQAGTLIVTVPNQYALDWLEQRLRHPILRTLRGIAGEDLAIEFRVQ